MFNYSNFFNLLASASSPPSASDWTDTANKGLAYLFGIGDGKPSGAVVDFYEQWNGYLNFSSGFFSIFRKLLGILAIGLWELVSAIESAFNALFKLTGFTDITQITEFNSWYSYFWAFGLVLGLFILVMMIAFSVFGKPLKYKSILQNLVIGCLVCTVLPTTVNSVISAVGTDAVNFSKSGSSLADQVVLQNVTDMVVVAGNNWKVYDNGNLISPDLIDGQVAIQPDQNLETNNKAGVTDSSDVLALLQQSGDLISNSGDNNMVGMINKKHDSAGAPFANAYKAGMGAIKNPTTMTNEGTMKFTKIFDSYYPRYKINWIGIYAQLIIFAVFFVSMGIRLVKSLFNIVVIEIVAPIALFLDTRDNRHLKEITTQILGAIASIWGEILVIRILNQFFSVAPGMIAGQANLGIIGNLFVTIMLYAGGILAAFQGVSYIEKLTGVSQSQGESLAGTMAGAGLLMRGGGSVMTATSSIANSVSRGASNIAKGIGGAFQAAKSPGQTAKAVAGGIKDSATAPFKEGAESVRNWGSGSEGGIDTSAPGEATVADGVTNVASDTAGNENSQSNTQNNNENQNNDVDENAQNSATDSNTLNRETKEEQQNGVQPESETNGEGQATGIKDDRNSSDVNQPSNAINSGIQGKPENMGIPSSENGQFNRNSQSDSGNMPNSNQTDFNSKTSQSPNNLSGNNGKGGISDSDKNLNSGREGISTQRGNNSNASRNSGIRSERGSIQSQQASYDSLRHNSGSSIDRSSSIKSSSSYIDHSPSSVQNHRPIGEGMRNVGMSLQNQSQNFNKMSQGTHIQGENELMEHQDED
ncbi:hypothetical protein EQG49_13385 [Periweissella cryptocerci]|uniref:DUF8208 domain-containing protein n=1 Tax=Periweissella cryptocerci TaxID=2506420 RepID=A0A4P6YX11_9LACO|nr:hypothetical protein [Periweissella cryptocerci]QBO37390.1 hypothetical protein EQG49_13385 [Periweissella cryptocerci]